MADEARRRATGSATTPSSKRWIGWRTIRHSWCNQERQSRCLNTHRLAPRVLIANSNLVPRWANWEEFDKLDAAGLMMYGQMTAGSWIYIGTQGILQGTYETFRGAAKKYFNDTLAGTITVTAGLGGMGGAQPLAIKLAGGVSICVEVDQSRIQRRLETRYLDTATDSLDEAIRLAQCAKAHEAISIGLTGNAAEMLPRW